MSENKPLRERLENLSKTAGKIHRRMSPLDFQRDRQIKKSAHREGFKFVGTGVESVVVQYPRNKDKLLALGLEQSEASMQKRLFYLNRLMRVLFPHNFTKLFFVSGKPDRSRVVGKQTKNNLTIQARERIKSSHSDWAIHDFYKSVLLPIQSGKLGVEFYNLDANADNLIIGLDGGQYLVDPINPEHVRRINVEKLEAYMRENKYSESDIDMALRSARRFIALSEAEAKK